MTQADWWRNLYPPLSDTQIAQLIEQQGGDPDADLVIADETVYAQGGVITSSVGAVTLQETVTGHDSGLIVRADQWIQRTEAEALGIPYSEIE